MRKFHVCLKYDHCKDETRDNGVSELTIVVWAEDAGQATTRAQEIAYTLWHPHAEAGKVPQPSRIHTF